MVAIVLKGGKGMEWFACRRVAIVLMIALSVICTVSAAAGSVDWPGFRGPFDNGYVRAPGDTAPASLPTQWSETENVKWKTPIPFKGWSSPVIAGGQIWMTTATPEGTDFYVICVDAETGAIRFNEKLFHSDSPEPLGNEINSYASPSPVIEPGRVYVHFGSYGTACLDTATCKVVWQRTDLPCRHYRGPGSSPFLFEDLLILTFDGVDLHYLTALDKKTGATVWKTDRTTAWNDLDETGKPKREGDCRKAFSTPLLIDAAGKQQLISPGSQAVYAYEPRTGKEIWKVAMPGYTPASRPVFGNGLVYITSGQAKCELLAVRVDGQGDVSNTHVAWRCEGGVPSDSSPLLIDDLFYMVSPDGLVSCLEAATGKPVWEQRIGGNYEASPIYADGLIYFFSVQGKVTVVKAGRAYEAVGVNKLDSGLMGSPAVLGKALILRTKTDLYRIEGGK
jgi:outer membrane protein assembly factor BamB